MVFYTGLWNVMSRTGLIIMRTRCCSQFCPREVKVGYFSPLRVLLAVGWVVVPGSWCHPDLAQRLSSSAKVSPHLLTSPVQWGGAPSDRVGAVQLGKYKRNPSRGLETSVSTCLVCAPWFGQLDNMWSRSAKLKLWWELAFISLCRVPSLTKLTKDALGYLWS